MITIIDYKIVNLASVANALDKLEIPYKISGDPFVIKNAQALILPGVGAAGQGMENLKTKGLDKIIIDKVKVGTPILGICLGMQLLFSNSEEGNVECLGLIDGKVKKFTTKLKVPQIGWNNVRLPRSLLVARNDKKRLLNNIPDNSYFYFANSYFCEPEDTSAIKGMTNYEINFSSVLESGNIFGTQFHPEKSGDVGLQLLNNFYSLVISSKSERSPRDFSLRSK